MAGNFVWQQWHRSENFVILKQVMQRFKNLGQKKKDNKLRGFFQGWQKYAGAVVVANQQLL